MSYVENFRDDSKGASGHPAQMVVDLLAGRVDDTNKLHANQLQTWYKDYATMRSGAALYKDNVDPYQ